MDMITLYAHQAGVGVADPSIFATHTKSYNFVGNLGNL